MKTTRIIALSLVAVLFVSLFSGCGGTKLAPGQVKGYLHDWFGEDAKTFDVQTDTSLQVYGLARELYSTLVRYKGNGFEMEPELLAELPTIDATGTVYNFKLKSGVKFHDGSVLKSSDVKFTMERMLDPNGQGASPWEFEPILGAKDIEDGKATSLAGFKVISDTEFEITLEKAYAPFLQNLAVPSASIYSEAACKAAGDKWAQQPVGTGPFKLKEYKQDQLIVLEKNPDYFEAGLPKLPGIDYRIIPNEATAIMEFEKGSLDIMSPSEVSERTRLEGLGKFTSLKSTQLITYYLTFNMTDPAFKDVRVRKAVAMAIDKQKMVDNILNGEGNVATSFVTPGIPGAYDFGKGPAYGYDAAAAKALVAEYGKPIKLELWQRGGESATNSNLAVQGFLKDVGIDCEIKIVDRAAFRDQRGKGLIPFNLGNWLADIPDADNYLWTYFHGPSDSKSMSVNLNDPKVNKWLEDARLSTDIATRGAVYQQVETYLIKDQVVVIPLYHSDAHLLTSKSVEGIALHPTGVNSYRLVSKTKGAK